MKNTIEARLTSLARRIFVQYQNQMGSEYAGQLDVAISICETYQQGMGNWQDLYEAVLGEGGIWEYSEGAGGFLGELETMWVMETCILLCSCWLGCQREGGIEPEDMELRGENIPDFLKFLENLPDIPKDCAGIREYFNKNLCW
ncbi:MAG: hypothetical protein K2N63_02185 [Lachnospiraceae bacterium]|nr:hypothetical protein [Lachnospiraceae bacterium]